MRSVVVLGVADSGSRAIYIHKMAAMSCQKERKRLFCLKEGLLDKSVSRKLLRLAKSP